MNRRLGIVILFALVVSAVASAVVYKLIAARLGLSSPRAAGQLLVATHDLQVGTLVSASDVKTVEWHRDAPPHAILRVEDVVGRGVVQAIYEGDPLEERRIGLRGAGGGLAATIPEGMRAVAVRVDDVAGVSGFAVPGMKVDVLASGTHPFSAPGQVPNKVAKIVLQNIAVLSAGQNLQKDSEGKPVTVPVVNLLVTPEQAELLSLATNEEKIQLVLRNPLDKAETKTNGVALAQLFGIAAAPLPVRVNYSDPKPVKARPVVTVSVPTVVTTVVAPRVVEVLHGTERAQTTFAGIQQ